MHPILSILLYKQVPGQLVIQMTDQCNALCPQCGMRANEIYKRSTLSIDDIKRILDAAAEKNIKAISFTGGEPLLHFEMLCELIDHAWDLGIPYIRSGTNGFVFKHPERYDFKSRVERLVDRLACTPIRTFWISIDSSVAHLHETMRGFKNVIKGIETALPIFHSYGLYPSANLGINRNVGGETTSSLRSIEGGMTEEDYLSSFYLKFKKAFQNFYQFIVDLGFTIVNTCYPMSIGSEESSYGLDAIYGATTINDIVRFNRTEKSLLFKALLETVKNFRSKIRIFSPLCALHMLTNQYNGAALAPFPCRGGIDFFFVDAHMANTYPCGYRGNESLGKFWELERERSESEKSCTLCDWECFRDPSELFGPIMELFSDPYNLGKKIIRDPIFFKYWLNDLLYYRACDFFDGRKAPNFKKLMRFKQSIQSPFLKNRTYSNIRRPIPTQQ